VTVLARARATGVRALRDGVLRPLASTLHAVEAEGVTFEVRQLHGFGAKTRGSVAADPFQPPWTPELLVEELGEYHALLLNKFPVFSDHLLIVTRRWQDQESPPDRADLEVLSLVLTAVDGLWFYNGGRAAGASQPHRHLQVVPRASLAAGIPLEARWLAALDSGQVDGFDFPHHVLPGMQADQLRAALGDDPGPHTLIGTRAVTIVVPRGASVVDGQPVNSLAYAGFLAAKTPEGVAAITQRGPFGVLAAAARSGLSPR
jgi:sulfate adenylyltransferase (ADP) / ATP adenylyltransferase